MLDPQNVQKTSRARGLGGLCTGGDGSRHRGGFGVGAAGAAGVGKAGAGRCRSFAGWAAHGAATAHSAAAGGTGGAARAALSGRRSITGSGIKSEVFLERASYSIQMAKML